VKKKVTHHLPLITLMESETLHEKLGDYSNL
jgi:hypothetical protein